MFLTAKPLFILKNRAASRPATGRTRHNEGPASGTTMTPLAQEVNPRPPPRFQSATSSCQLRPASASRETMHHPVQCPCSHGSLARQPYRNHVGICGDIAPQSLPHGRMEYEIWPPRLKGASGFGPRTPHSGLRTAKTRRPMTLGPVMLGAPVPRSALDSSQGARQLC